MKSTNVRTSATSSLSPSSGKSELQRKLQSMVIACRDKDVVNAGGKLSHTELRMKRAEAQMNFAKTSPAALASLPIESSPGSHKSSLDPLQNCYGRASAVTTSSGPKGILTKPSTPKVSKVKRVTWNVDLESDIPSRPDSPYNPDPANTIHTLAMMNTPTSANNSLPNVEQKSPLLGGKKPLFQIAKPTRPSLSEQLSLIANKASDITADIKAKAGISDNLSGTTEQPLFTLPAKNFTVGNLQCRYQTTF